MASLFVFGNTPELSSLELSAVLSREKITTKILFENSFGRVIEADDFEMEKLFGKLGGTVKMAQVIGNVADFADLDQIDPMDFFPEKKLTFGLSVYGKPVTIQELKEACEDLKTYLQEQGKTVRYVLPTEGSVLSSVVVEKQKVVELLLFFEETSSQYYLAKTLEVSDFTGWNHRDYDRPKVDPHIGMLPPRVARMMVNLALRAAETTVLDPFCGVGTILSEGLMIGANVVGSDLSKKQVEATRENLEWLEKEYSVSGMKYSVFETDARNISAKLGGQKVDAVVTEPDLGPNRGMNNNQLSMINKLETLYVESLEEWKKVLKPGGKVVIALPSFFQGKDEDRSIVTHIVDKAQIMGYSLEAGPVMYRRPQVNVGRNIAILKLV